MMEYSHPALLLILAAVLNLLTNPDHLYFACYNWEKSRNSKYIYNYTDHFWGGLAFDVVALVKLLLFYVLKHSNSWFRHCTQNVFNFYNFFFWGGSTFKMDEAYVILHKSAVFLESFVCLSVHLCVSLLPKKVCIGRLSATVWFSFDLLCLSVFACRLC